MENKDIERTRQIYQEALKLIPHKKFTFAKIWIMKAQFEIRQQQLQGKIPGNPISSVCDQQLIYNSSKKDIGTGDRHVPKGQAVQGVY